MPFNFEQRQKIADIINTALSPTEFSDLVATRDDISPQDNFGGLPLIKWVDSNDNPITKIFDQSTHNRIFDRGQFFHFKSFERGKLILRNKSIQISNLLSNEENDFAEYSEFFKRIGLFYQLLPKDYCKFGTQGKFSLSSKSIIDEARGNIMILCFTKDGHNELFWKNYADDDKGICLVLRFTQLASYRIHLYTFRDVCYDDGYQFDFINDINYHLAKSFGRQLFLEGCSKFSKFYKRGKYSWENESRLVLDYDFSLLGYGHELNKLSPIQEDVAKGRKYIEMPLIAKEGDNILFDENPFFTLIIDEVVCGRKVTLDQYEELETIIKAKFPHTRIWQRK